MVKEEKGMPKRDPYNYLGLINQKNEKLTRLLQVDYRRIYKIFLMIVL